MQMPSDVVAAIADWFSLVISRSAVAGKEEIVGVLCLLHTVQEKRRVTQPRGVFSQNLCLWLSVPTIPWFSHDGNGPCQTMPHCRMRGRGECIHLGLDAALFLPSFLPSFFHLAKYPHSASSSLWSEHARLLTSIAPSLSFSILFRRRRPPPRNGRRGGGGRTSQSAAEVGLIIIAVVLPPSLPPFLWRPRDGERARSAGCAITISKNVAARPNHFFMNIKLSTWCHGQPQLDN